MMLKVVLFHHSFIFREMYGLHLQDGNQILIVNAVETSKSYVGNVCGEATLHGICRILLS